MKTNSQTELTPRAPQNGALLHAGPTPIGQAPIRVSRPPAVSADLAAVKARQKATWEAGDFGQLAPYNMPAAEEFMSRLVLRPGLRLLDAACGTGNLAVIAARAGCRVSGVDLAANLIDQARERVRASRLFIPFMQGDAEALPYADGVFDAVVSMFGVMFTPRPEVVSHELHRVTRPGGWIALANWTPEGAIGKMFNIFKAHLPPVPGTVPSTLLWGDEPTVRERLWRFADVSCTRRTARLRYPFSPADTVEFFRQYYGPTQKAFAALDERKQKALRSDLVRFQIENNTATEPDQTELLAEYLEITATRPANDPPLI